VRHNGVVTIAEAGQASKLKKGWPTATSTVMGFFTENLSPQR